MCMPVLLDIINNDTYMCIQAYMYTSMCVYTMCNIIIRYALIIKHTHITHIIDTYCLVNMNTNMYIRCEDKYFI